MEFPSPVGGVALPSDFAPSIVFATLYGLLLPVLAYRIIDRRSRNVLLIGTMSFAIERIIIFSLRAVQSHNPARRDSKGLTTYMQVTIGMGFVGIAQDLVNLLRVLLVKSTVASEERQTTSLHAPHGEIQMQPPAPQASHILLLPGSSVDNPRLRFRYRRFADVLNLAFLSATVPGVIGGSHYGAALTNSIWAARVMRLRYASTSVALFMIFMIAGSMRWASGSISSERRKAIRLMYGVCGLLSLIAVYRLAVMHNQTTSLTSLSPSSLNTPVAKATFYVFHMLPEWITAALLLGFNIREMFDTGPWGDWRAVDETEREKKKRLAREAQKGAERNASP